MPEPSMRMLHRSTPEEAAAVVAAVLMFRESSVANAPGALARAPASGRTA